MITKPLMPNAENALNIEVAITEARDSIKRIEGSTERISKIVQSTAVPRNNRRRRDDIQDFSIRFISVILVCIVVVLGLFGVMFFNITRDTDEQITDLTRRVNQLEQAIKPPLHSSGQ